MWIQQTHGESGGSVYRLAWRDGREAFIKHGRDGVAAAIRDEYVRLCWFAGKAPVPDVRHFEDEGTDTWLLTSLIAGQTAYDRLKGDAATRPAIAEAIAKALRALHALDLRQCPFDATPDHRLHLARRNIDEGRVDADDFDEDRSEWVPEQVWERLMQLRPDVSDLVVSHGDYSLDNVLIADAAVSGVIDVGRAGRSDPYQDIAIMWRDLGEFGAGLQDRFLNAYGLADIDQRKLEFFLCLDELF
jgi:aminoglycoside 3'-phosphotransferase-1